MTPDTLAHRLAQLANEDQEILASDLPRDEKEKRRAEIAEKRDAIFRLRKKANAQKVNKVSPAEQESRRFR